MAGPQLSVETERRLRLVFMSDRQVEVARLLVEQCGNNIPLCDKYDEFQMERIRFAVLKLSEGDMTKLLRALAVAKEDWRDVLVAAGFGHDPRAHERWLPGA